MFNIPVREDTKKMLLDIKNKLNTTWDNVIKTLIFSYNKYSPPEIENVSNEILATIGVIYIMRNNKSEYLRLISFLVNKEYVDIQEVVDKFGANVNKLISFLDKYRIIHIITTGKSKKIKLLCYPQELKTPKNVILRIMFTPDFCRIYCPNVDSCYIYKRISSNNTLAGRDFVFDVVEYEKSSIEELIGKCISSCIGDRDDKL